MIVDYDDPHSAALVLQNAYQSSAPHKTVTVALLGDKTKVRHVFGAGANFVLYKPISQQQAEASLRAAMALMKRERRRSFRVPVQLPGKTAGRKWRGDGRHPARPERGRSGRSGGTAAVPGRHHQCSFRAARSDTEMDIRGEVAWANPNGESGVRYIDLPDNLRQTLKAWVVTNAAEFLPEDPEPVSECKLTDLSLGGCYVETESPFPERSGIVLCLKAEDMEVQAEGMVRVMHPEFGMGIEFASGTAEQREHVGTFINFLTSRPGTLPQLLITPRALAALNEQDYRQQPRHPTNLKTCCSVC